MGRGERRLGEGLLSGRLVSSAEGEAGMGGSSVMRRDMAGEGVFEMVIGGGVALRLCVCV